MQVTHAPPLHTLPVPHDVPFGAIPVSRQTGAPVLQTVMPTRQGLPATMHADPETHATQLPESLQTKSLPHEVPTARFVPVSVQEFVPAAQTREPLWQGFVGVQAAPPMQATHVPA